MDHCSDPTRFAAAVVTDAAVAVHRDARGIAAIERVLGDEVEFEAIVWRHDAKT